MKYGRYSTILFAIVLSCWAARGAAADPPERFEGGYFGAQAGFGSAAAEFTIGDFSIFDSEASGRLLGLHGGYGWQTGRRFWGVELSAGYSGVKNQNLSPVLGTTWLRGEIERIFAVSLVGRAGVVVGEDRDTLIYGFAGPSIIRIEARASLTDVGSVDEGTPYPGLAVGLGLEHFFSDNVSGRVHAAYTKYWEVDEPIGRLPVRQDYNLDTAAVVFGVTWWFDR